MRYKHFFPIATVVLTACTVLAALPAHAFTGPELLQAVREGDHSRITHLLSNGTDVDYCTEQGNTALMVAAKIGDKPTIQSLLKWNPDVNFQNRTGTTALMIAAKYGNKHIIQMLLDKGADPSITNNSGISAARFAQAYDHFEVYRQLVDAERTGMKKQQKTKITDVTMNMD